MVSHKVETERYISNLQSEDDESFEVISSVRGFRPESFKDYPGQEFVKENLKIYVEAAKQRKAALDHIVLHGPPGLGKTTLALIVSKELGVPFKTTSGPSIDRPGDLAGILAGLEEKSVLFIDEIHRLPIQVEEVLYSAMEDFVIDVVVGQGPSARSVKLPIQPFTLIGATTKLSHLSRPFLNRFGIQEKLDYYSAESLRQIIHRGAQILGRDLTDEGALSLAQRARGTPRIALRLLRRVVDFADVEHKSLVDRGIVDYALARLDINELGLDKMDRDILQTIHSRFSGGPIGIEALAISLGEERATIEEVYEPYLVHQGLVSRGPRGRSLTEKAVRYLECQGD